jgi:NAD(P)H-flavin reductase
VISRITEDHTSLADFDVYVAGSEGLVAAVERLLPERGLPRDQLYVGYIV